jgi:hypothetical protein
MRKFLVLSILVCILVSCSTPTTEKPAEAKPVFKESVRYFYEFIAMSQEDFDSLFASIPSRYLTNSEIETYWNIARTKAISKASNYTYGREPFYDYFIPMGITLKEADAMMDRIDERGNGLFSVTYNGRPLFLYVEVQ